MRQIDFEYAVHEVAPYVNYAYFFHAWGVREDATLLADARALLKEWAGRVTTRGRVVLLTARRDGDDIVLEGGERMCFLRQQRPNSDGTCLAWSDYINKEYPQVGVFVATVTGGAGFQPAGYGGRVSNTRPSRGFITHAYYGLRGLQTHATGARYNRAPHTPQAWRPAPPVTADPYRDLLAQTLADRLAEATAERVHEAVRRLFTPDESFTVDELFKERYVGRRPAVGYPSLPDQSLNFQLARLLRFDELGVSLTENGLMLPHASTSGLIIFHPEARHFAIGPISEEQLTDYALRRGADKEWLRRFVNVY